MNLTYPPIGQAVAWTMGNAIAAKLLGGKVTTGILFGTAYSLVKVAVNQAVHPLYTDVPSSDSDHAKNSLLAIVRLVIATCIAATGVNLLDRSLKMGTAYRIQYATVMLWSTVFGVISLAAERLSNHYPDHKWTQALECQLQGFLEWSSRGPEYELALGGSQGVPISATWHAFAAIWVNEKALTGALLGAGLGLTLVHMIRTPIQIVWEYLNNGSPSEDMQAFRGFCTVVASPFLATKSIQLLGYPVTMRRAFRIQLMSVILVAVAYFLPKLWDPSTRAWV